MNTTVNTMLETLRQDIGYALRSARRNPGYVLATSATLALGIGAVTAIFSIISGVLLRPLPYRNPDRLVQVAQNVTADGPGPVFLADMQVWRARSTRFAEFAGYANTGRNLYGAGEPERIQGVLCERNLLHLLGVQPLAGRTIRADDPPNVAVIGAGLWKRRFGADRSWIGRSITLDHDSYTLIGVMPEEFQFPYRAKQTELWIPWNVTRPANTNSRTDSVVGRVREGVAFETARAELMAISPRPVSVVRLSDHVSGKVRQALLVLFGAAGLLWLAACANSANMLFARAAKRAHEMAVRTALGAGRARLMRQLLAESLLLSGCAGVAGLALGMGGMHLMLRLAGTRIPRAWEIGFDWRVFGFLAATTVLTGIVFGLLPAFVTSQADPQSALKQASRSGGSGRLGRRIRDFLVIAEIGLSFVLLVSAGILMDAFLRLRNTPTGLAADNVLTMRITHLNSDYQAPGSYGRYVQKLENRITSVPGVRSAGFIQYLPLRNSGWWAYYAIEGRPPVRDPDRLTAELRYVSPGYFQTMQIPLREGRYLTERDTPETPLAIVVNEALARRDFPNENPVGRKTNRGVIVGVVGDVRSLQIDKPATPEIYYCFAQNTAATSDAGVSLVVRSVPRPESMALAVRNAIRELNPRQAVFDVSTMKEVVAESLADANAYVWLIGVFAGLALLVAVSGVYGVVALVVTARQREFAIRRALGATGSGIARLVFRQGAAAAVGGLVIGSGGVWAVRTLLRSLVSGVRPAGWETVLPVAVMLAGAALLACVGPARQAVRVDPQAALKEE